jgi:hypothetical protein
MQQYFHELELNLDGYTEKRDISLFLQENH